MFDDICVWKDLTLNFSKILFQKVKNMFMSMFNKWADRESLSVYKLEWIYSFNSR